MPVSVPIMVAMKLTAEDSRRSWSPMPKGCHVAPAGSDFRRN
uniref:Alternative protein CALN1 n=1 Tax=Homo sapiens TaxID=9606 RepID=L8ECK9_HUMAN|nr:alternative protein CALN1 [Homo sapiens]